MKNLLLRSTVTQMSVLYNKTYMLLNVIHMPKQGTLAQSLYILFLLKNLNYY